MALPAFSLDTVLELSRSALDQYFDEFARYDETSPRKTQYRIRVGSHCFYSHDTMELKSKMITYLGRERRKRTLARKYRRDSRKGSGA